ncbi:HNH endonuclease signature motif containing protein [Spiribacter halobius]|uniref:HNH endonuclease n=1 Tax=Sediminicurvatus halobius TaxID=2182432 RepID=A0A2U2MXM9_9GAMM|nr:HNH endonuclease signature motif containing protein [Spiribacter halobius]PWG61731.1 HNH endonuclease [Spiribacter halobius]UEX76841.1 HNH endonuclease [Spiribacter halobius]
MAAHTGTAWTDIELSWLEALYADTPNRELGELLGRNPRAVGLKARQLGLRKSEAFMARPEHNGRFRRGQSAWNKGQQFDSGGRSRETRFQPGERPHTWVPVGTETTDADGYLKRKVRDDAPPGMSRRNWRYVHVMLWEEHYGPVPRSHAVIFRNGDRTDLRIENLECIPRSELGRRNSMWTRYPRPVAEAVHMRGVLKRRIREIQEKRHEEPHR